MRWAVDDGTGLALVVPSNPWHWHLVEPWRFVSGWPGVESSEDTFANTPTHLVERVISHYGRECLPSDPHESPTLTWFETILREFRDEEVFLLGPWTVHDGCAHFQHGDSLVWFGSRADALSEQQLSMGKRARWALIWLTLSAICAGAYLDLYWYPL